MATTNKTDITKIIAAMRLAIQFLKAGEGEAALRQAEKVQDLLTRELAK